MTDIRWIETSEEKSAVARRVLEGLRDWFEVDQTREAYIADCAGWPVVAAFDGDTPVGFLAMKATSPYAVEIAVMGVDRACHRRDIGRGLFEAARERARAEGYRFMQVKTVRAGVYPEYDATNRFYQKLGFLELEVFETLWDAANPCQVYVMAL